MPGLFDFENEKVLPVAGNQRGAAVETHQRAQVGPREAAGGGATVSTETRAMAYPKNRLPI